MSRCRGRRRLWRRSASPVSLGLASTPNPYIEDCGGNGEGEGGCSGSAGQGFASGSAELTSPALLMIIRAPNYPKTDLRVSSCLRRAKKKNAEKKTKKEKEAKLQSVSLINSVTRRPLSPDTFRWVDASAYIRLCSLSFHFPSFISCCTNALQGSLYALSAAYSLCVATCSVNLDLNIVCKINALFSFTWFDDIF